MKTILFFGIIREYKGLKHLLKAFEELPKDTNLLIVGESWEEVPEIHNHIYKHRITHINRYIEDMSIPYYFSQADVLVLPYERASSSGVAHIGMSFGLPIVATNVGGLAESLSNYQGSLIINDISLLKDAIIYALDEMNVKFPVPKQLTFTYLEDMWPYNVTIIGPSHRFESGISHYTVSLANSLGANCVLFRDMIPKFLFPGRERIGKAVTNHQLVHPYIELLDWWNPLTWIRAGKYLNRSVILEWWTSSVAHMYLFIMLMHKRNYIIEYHEIVDPKEHHNCILAIYTKVIGKLIANRATSYVVHSNADKVAISKYYNIPAEQIEVIPHGLYNYHR